MENHVDFLGLIYCCSPSYQGKGTMMRPLVTSTLGYRDRGGSRLAPPYPLLLEIRPVIGVSDISFSNRPSDDTRER